MTCHRTRISIWNSSTRPRGGANGQQGTQVQDNQRTNNGQNCANATCFGDSGVLGIRAGYMLIRNFAGFQGLSVKADRQYVVFGSQSLFGAFDLVLKRTQ